jgi:hypothetical protein
MSPHSKRKKDQVKFWNYPINFCFSVIRSGESASRPPSEIMSRIHIQKSPTPFLLIMGSRLRVPPRSPIKTCPALDDRANDGDDQGYRYWNRRCVLHCSLQWSGGLYSAMAVGLVARMRRPGQSFNFRQAFARPSGAGEAVRGVSRMCDGGRRDVARMRSRHH